MERIVSGRKYPSGARKSWHGPIAPRVLRTIIHTRVSTWTIYNETKYIFRQSPDLFIVSVVKPSRKSLSIVLVCPSKFLYDFDYFKDLWVKLTTKRTDCACRKFPIETVSLLPTKAGKEELEAGFPIVFNAYLTQGRTDHLDFKKISGGSEGIWERRI